MAPTLSAERNHQMAPADVLLDNPSIRGETKVVRTVADGGFTLVGVELAVVALTSEVTVSADGFSVSSVGAGHDDHLARTEIFPLRDAISEVRQEFARARADAGMVQQWAACP